MESSRRPPCFTEDVEITKQSSLLTLINRPRSSNSTLRSLRSFSVSGFSSPRSRSGRSLYFEEPHFLEVCSLCQKHLGANSNIFMYRGDTPFCSEDCRQEQIDIDEAKEKNLNLSFTMKAALRKKEQKQTSSSSQDYSNYHTGTLAAA